MLVLTGDLIHDWSGLTVALDLIAALRPARGGVLLPGQP